MAVNILAIESSCDDTGAAVIADGKVLSNIIAGQAVHEQYGGGGAGARFPRPPGEYCTRGGPCP